MRHCSFAQESTRYVKYDGKMVFIKPVWFTFKLPFNWGNSQNNINSEEHAHLPLDVRSWIAACLQSEIMYKSFIKNYGWKPQQAREVLPNSLKTEIVVKANIREWRHIFSLRCDKAAHPQMVALMQPLANELSTRIPILFDEYATNN